MTLFLDERTDDAIGVVLAAGLFTIAIAAAVRKQVRGPREGAFFDGARRAS